MCVPDQTEVARHEISGREEGRSIEVGETGDVGGLEDGEFVVKAFECAVVVPDPDGAGIVDAGFCRVESIQVVDVGGYFGHGGGCLE